MGGRYRGFYSPQVPQSELVSFGLVGLGSPIEGFVKGRNTSPYEKMAMFFLLHVGRFQTRSALPVLCSTPVYFGWAGVATVVSAIHDATGIWFKEQPVTSEKTAMALKEKGDR